MTTVEQGWCDRCGRYCTFVGHRGVTCWPCAKGARMTDLRDHDQKSYQIRK